MQQPLGLPVPDNSFWVVALAVLIMLAFSILFTLATVWLRAASRRMQRRWQELEADWEPLILAVLAGDLPKSDLHERVQERDRRNFVSFLIRYARRLRGVEREVLLELAEPYLDLIARDLEHRSPELRARALQILGDLGTDRYGEALIRGLDDRASLVAMTAVQALAQHYDRSHADQLLRGVERFESWTIPFLANMLANMGPDSSEQLRATLSDRTRPERVRAVAALTLAALNDLAAVDIATEVISSEHHADLVIGALELLEKVGSREQLPAVRKLLGSSDARIRGAALRTLSRLGASDDVTHLRTALDDESNWVALDAARGLREMGQLDYLAEFARSDHPRAVAAQEVLWEAQQ